MPGGEDIVDLDAEAAVAAVEAALRGDGEPTEVDGTSASDGDGDGDGDAGGAERAGRLHVAAAFTPEAYTVVRRADDVASLYEDEAAMAEHFDRIHAYAGLDFSEIGLFSNDLFPAGGGVEYLATGMEHLTLVRVYAGREGLLFTLSGDADVRRVVEAVRDAVEPSLGASSAAGTVPVED